MKTSFFSITHQKSHNKLEIHTNKVRVLWRLRERVVANGKKVFQGVKVSK